MTEQIITARRRCTRCGGKRDATLKQTVTTGGQVSVGWVCQDCGSPTRDGKGRQYVPHEELRAEGIEPDALPVYANYAAHTRCVVCGSRGAQEHHWAPKHVFGADVAEAWPVDYLCQVCHDHWHREMKV